MSLRKREIAILPFEGERKTWLVIVGFFLPFLGILLYFLWRTNKPLYANSVGFGIKMYVIMVIVGFAVTIVSVLLS